MHNSNYVTSIIFLVLVVALLLFMAYTQNKINHLCKEPREEPRILWNQATGQLPEICNQLQNSKGEAYEN